MDEIIENNQYLNLNKENNTLEFWFDGLLVTAIDVSHTKWAKTHVMNAEAFNQVVLKMQEWQRNTLVSKAEEYATEQDRLHNFKKIADFVGITPAQVALVLMLKNLVSLTDAIMDGRDMTEEFLNEKIGDPYNYLPLIRALVEEK